jgi:WD40 repeat protein
VVRVWDKNQNKVVPQEGIPFDDVEGVRRLSESVPPMFDPSTASVMDTMKFFGELPKEGLLAGHLSKITSIAFNPKRNILASGSADNTIRLWKLEKNGTKYSLNCYEVLTGHTENVQWLNFNPNGDLLASGSDDQSVRLWRIGEAGEEIQSSALLSDEKIKNVSFSPDGQLLLAAAGETIHFWDVISGQKLHSNTTDHEALSGLSFHPKGHILASSGSRDWSIKFWYLNSQINTLHSDDTFYTSMAISPNGLLCATATEKNDFDLSNYHNTYYIMHCVCCIINSIFLNKYTYIYC